MWLITVNAACRSRGSRLQEMEKSRRQATIGMCPCQFTPYVKTVTPRAVRATATSPGSPPYRTDVLGGMGSGSDVTWVTGWGSRASMCLSQESCGGNKCRWRTIAVTSPVVSLL